MVDLAQEARQEAPRGEGSNPGRAAPAAPDEPAAERAQAAAVGCNMRAVGWHAPSRQWRVQLPAAFEAPVRYFSPRACGGIEEALAAALAWRDREFACRQIDPALPRYYTQRQRRAGERLPIYECHDRRTGRLLVVGYWMEGQGSARRQRRITRSVGIRGYRQARREVEAAVLAALERQA